MLPSPFLGGGDKGGKWQGEQGAKGERARGKSQGEQGASDKEGKAQCSRDKWSKASQGFLRLPKLPEASKATQGS